MLQATYSRLSNYGVSLVIPILNERDNIDTLINGIMALTRNKHTERIKEIIFVDDGSNDGTRERIKQFSQIYADLPIMLIERDTKRGTVNAQLCGISAARFENVIVMDGDLQHPVKYLPSLIEKYSEGYDLVLASRYARGGTVERTPVHGAISRGATFLAKFMLPWTRELTDPISGFFIVSKQAVSPQADLTGYNKLSLYILSTKSKLSFAEIPFDFVDRTRGKSKVSDGSLDFIFKYVNELKHYRHLGKMATPRKRSRSSTAENKNFWNH